MAETSRIEWTDTTWNPVTGCTKVSPGCDRCYAETFAQRWQGVPGHHFEAGFDVTLRPERLQLPLGWRRGRRVFVNSMADLFHQAVPDTFIADVFATMAVTPQHTYQLLTKRHARLQALVASDAFHALVWRYCHALVADGVVLDDDYEAPWPLPNVKVGVSAETQQWADIRLPALEATPAAARFVSCEPLLGPIDLSRWVGTEFSLDGLWQPATAEAVRVLDWVIVGGESGAGARAVDEWWIGDLVDQAQAGGVAVFVKQLGTAWARAHGHRGKGADPAVWPEHLRVRELPTIAAPAGAGVAA